MRRLYRNVVTIVTACMVWLCGVLPNIGYAAEMNPGLASSAVSAILMDETTGTVMFEKNADQKLPPASITKVMTMLLAMEAIDNGRLKLTDKIKTSEHAASMGGSQIFLEPGEVMTAEDMLKGIAVASANDASVALAEHLAGSETNFVQIMNERATQLGCKNTHFVNPNGLPVQGHYSSARDIALICRELLKHESIAKFTSIYEDHLRKGSDKPFWLVNTNKLVRFYEGMDGLKTGYTAQAKYCLAATAKRNDFRSIAVVLGEPTSKVRNAEVTEMMNYAFATYESKRIYRPFEVVGEAKVRRGMQTTVNAVVDRPMGLLMKKGATMKGIERTVVLETPTAPLAKGQVIGYVAVKRDGAEVLRVPLIAQVEIKRANWLHLLGRTFTSWVSFGHSPKPKQPVPARP